MAVWTKFRQWFPSAGRIRGSGRLTRAHFMPGSSAEHDAEQGQDQADGVGLHGQSTSFPYVATSGETGFAGAVPTALPSATPMRSATTHSQKAIRKSSESEHLTVIPTPSVSA